MSIQPEGVGSLDERIARFNACGPFPHGYYNLDGDVVSHEGPMRGRADLLVSTADRCASQLAADLGCDRSDLGILDVGAYDGWILNQLWTRGYHRLTGLEPRNQNVSRGKRLRSLLGIEDEVNHIVGTLTEDNQHIEGAPFDVTLCFGVLHHLDDIAGFLRKLRATCRGVLVLECLTLSDDLMTDELKRAIEPKDVAYRDREAQVSLIGVKLESSYYPGSSAHDGIVFIPGQQALVWMLEDAGFEVTEVLEGWQTAMDAEEMAHRMHATSTIVIARPTQSIGNPYLDQIKETERVACTVSLADSVLAELQVVVERNPLPLNPELAVELARIASDCTPEGRELVRALIHAPHTKLSFERAKAMIREGHPEAARDELLAIVSRPSDDWRSVYRSFALLSRIDAGRRSFWLEMLRDCNPEFPIAAMD